MPEEIKQLSEQKVYMIGHHAL